VDSFLAPGTPDEMTAMMMVSILPMHATKAILAPDVAKIPR
jgi:molybdopterin-biosynthesis enzyme MoeA-like protein